MTKSDYERSGKQRIAHAEKKRYEKPRILSTEKLEVVAAVCSTKVDLDALCLAAGPTNS